VTWGGAVPIAGDAVSIPSGKAITLDTATPMLGSLMIDGDLVVSSTVNTHLQSRNVTINGTGRYLSGSEEAPNNRLHRLTLGGAMLTVSGNPGGGAVISGPTHTGDYGSCNTPTGNNGTTNDDHGFYRGLLIMDGGQLVLHAARPAVLKAKLGAHAAKTNTSITLDRPVTWKAGDIVVIENTDFYGAVDAGTERLVVAADVNNSTSVTFTAPLAYNHWGLLQYPNDDKTISTTQGSFTNSLTSSYTGSISGATMTISAVSSGTISVGQRVYGANIAPYTFITALGTGTGGVGTYMVSVSQTAASGSISCRGMRATDSTPNVIDQRALVVNCSRSHIIEGDNDTEWTTNGMGAHQMAMGLGSRVVIKGVQYQRVGQRGMLGRYPWHFHMPAYDIPTGAVKTNPLTGLSDGYFQDGQAVIEDCSVLDSMNRIVSLHGCRGVLVKNAFGDNIAGHAYFLEDGSEIGNTFDSCQVTRVVDPGASYRIKIHDSSPSGFWIPNLDNNFITTNGIKSGASDCAGHGIFISQAPNRSGYPGGCFGLSGQVALEPYYTPPTNWQGIVSHSNGMFGREASGGVIDEGGNNDPPNNRTRPQGTLTHKYMTGLENIVAGQVFGEELWKCTYGAYLNNQYIPLYDGWVVADNNGKGFQGLTDFGEIQNCLLVERTLNNANPAGTGGDIAQVATIGYHGSLIPKDCSVFGFDVTSTPFKNMGMDRFGGTLFVPRSFVDYHDNYLAPVTCFTREMSNLRIASKMSMYLPPFPDMTYEAPFNTWSGTPTTLHRNGSGACAILDYEGVFFNQGAGRYALIDHPFVTTGAANLVTLNNASDAYVGMVTTTSVMYGLFRREEGATTIYGSDGTDLSAAPFAWQRVDPAPANFTDIASASFKACDGDTYGVYTDGGYSAMCTYPSGSWARVYHHEVPATRYKQIGFDVICGEDDGGFCGIGVPWRNADAFVMRRHGSPSTSVANKADLLASTTSTFWRDTTNEIVWVKMIQDGGAAFTPTSGTTYPSGTFYRDREGFTVTPFRFSLT